MSVIKATTPHGQVPYLVILIVQGYNGYTLNINSSKHCFNSRNFFQQ